MTFAPITTALDTARPAEAEMASSTAVAQYLADSCLADAPLGSVGVEMEGHCHDPADPYRRPSWAEINDVIELLPALPGDSAVTVEPGGAVELSGPPADGVMPAIDAMNRDQAVLRSAF